MLRSVITGQARVTAGATPLLASSSSITGVIGDGTHAKLIERGGFYADLRLAWSVRRIADVPR